ncbi:MAG: hypothetical protein KAG61_03300 [Bacteriovoracaceae bacterium]|nr:hypothetical protein [Bacteriovoracaceae bacterium]
MTRLILLATLLISSSILAAPFGKVISKKCLKPTVTSCLALSALGENCRKQYPKQCAKIINTNYKKQYSKHSRTRKTLVPFKLNPNARSVRVKSKEVSPVKSMYQSGMTTIPQLQQIPVRFAEYDKKYNTTLTPIRPVLMPTKPVLKPIKPILKPIAAKLRPHLLTRARLDFELKKKKRWNSQVGHESCDEYASEQYHHISAIEDYMALNKSDISSILDFLVSKNHVSRYPFLSTTHGASLGKLNIGSYHQPNSFFHDELLHRQNGKKNLFASMPRQNSAWRDFDKIDISQRHKDLIVRAHLDYKSNLSTSGQIRYARNMKTTNISVEYLEALQRLQEGYQKTVNQRLSMLHELERLELAALNCSSSLKCEQARNKYAGLYQYSRQVFPAMDRSIREYLVKGEKAGCFDQNSTLCDWAPSLSLKLINGGMRAFQEHRNFWYKTCTDALRPMIDGSGLPYVYPTKNYTHLLQNGNYANSNPRSWKNNRSDFTKYMHRAYEYNKSVIEEQKRARKLAKINHPTRPGKFQLGSERADKGFYGTGKLGGIGAGYSYSAGWSINDYEDDVSKVNPEAHTNFDLHALIFGYRKDIISYNASIQTLPTNESKLIQRMKVNGVSWLAPIDVSETESSGVQFIIKDSNEKKVFTKSKHISVFGVPIKLELGALAKVGVESEVDHTVNRRENSHQTIIRLNGTMAPMATATAYASASVDAFLADVGVRGYLDLIRVDIPYDINFAIMSRSGDHQSSFTVKNDLNLRLSTLNGRVAAFIDSMFGDVEKTLVSWDGPSISYPLIKSEVKERTSLEYSSSALGLNE